MFDLMVAATVLVGIFGGMASYIGLKAFKRNREGSFLFASAGFSLVAVGTILGAVACPVYTLNEVEVHLAESGLVASGLLSILYSISRVGHSAKPR